MKKINYILLLIGAFCLLTVNSCKKKQLTRDEQIAEFRAQLTQADTTEMLKVCDTAMELLKGKKIDEVIETLYEYNDSTKEISPVSKEMKKRLQHKFKIFPVLEYERKYYSFMLEGCNDVKYEITFATAEQIGSVEPAKTAFMFNPVRVDGEWKLCVKTSTDEVDLEKL